MRLETTLAIVCVWKVQVIVAVISAGAKNNCRASGLSRKAWSTRLYCTVDWIQ
jgi:hypothetical protein